MIVQIVSGCCWTRLWMDFRDLGFGNFSALCCTAQWTEKGAWLSYYGTGAGPGLGQAQATQLRATLHSQVFCPSLVAQKIAWKVKHASYRVYCADSLHFDSTQHQNLFRYWFFLPDGLSIKHLFRKMLCCVENIIVDRWLKSDCDPYHHQLLGAGLCLWPSYCHHVIQSHRGTLGEIWKITDSNLWLVSAILWLVKLEVGQQ